MARRRRPGARTSVADDRAEIIIPLDSIIDPSERPIALSAVSKWLRRVDEYPSVVSDARDGVALVLDRFAWDLHLSDLAHATDTHDGNEFFDAAVSAGSVAVYVVSGLDPRRSKPEEIDAAARSGHMFGASVTAFPVDVLQS